MNRELPDVQAGFRKGLGMRDQIANIHWIIEKKQQNSRKTSTSASLTTLKPLTMDHNCGKFLRRWEYPATLPASWETCMYAGQEAIIRTRHGTMDWFRIGKGVHQGCILSPCLFNLYAEYTMWNAGLNESQAKIKIAGKNINNLRYAVIPL